MESRSIQKRPESWPWYAAMAVVGLGILALTVMNFLPVFAGEKGPTPDDHKVTVPAFDYSSWHALATQNGGRFKPFETAAIEVLRQITGRSRLQGQDAVAVILMWMLQNDPGEAKPRGAWDTVSFILCEHQDLRRLIFRLQDNGSLGPDSLTYEQVHGKFISPVELAQFKKRIRRLEAEDRETYREMLTPVERQVGEVLHRLDLYESIRQTQSPVYGKLSADPFAVVALDQVPGSPWFSLTEVRLLDKTPALWQDLMKERVKNAPQLYVSPEHQESLAQFQKKVQEGKGAEEADALASVLAERRHKVVQDFFGLRQKGDKKKADELLTTVVLSVPTVEGAAVSPARKNLAMLYKQELDDMKDKKSTDNSKEIAASLTTILQERDNQVLIDLKERLPLPQSGYHPDDPRFRMLHLTYLETRFPDVYQTAVQWQKPPLAEARNVLAALDRLGQAYRAGEPAAFAEASQAFFNTLREVSEKFGAYPGEDTVADRVKALLSGGFLNAPSEELLGLELTFNHTKPFMWAWILMLGALLFFCLSLGLNSRTLYLVAFGFYGLSLAFQVFGFFTRIIISGRPPVTNMYETVIWVSFMSGIFALILEVIYRRKVIALAGALVATLGLVLADQLPLALDPKINPLVPVLRSNFWLTIHVLTIVSSYAGGTLAWGLGNITLFLILFGGSRRETIKTLSQFTYRALQIAVLLLAAGTFLGGWWAAYSWGRFWGWDPKETGALIALLCYVIPLHMRYIGWIKDFGLAVAAILCYAAILMSWYGVNFVFPAGLHSYGFGGGGAAWVYWACLINIEWVLVAGLLYRNRTMAQAPPAAVTPVPAEEVERKSEYIKV
jgi:ABC-type transport system involved in cytochrome c biogenesis permease subunit